MRDEQSIETEATELLRTLIRNKCVNDGTGASGQETRSVSALETYFNGAGVACERYTSEPGRESLIARIDGSDPKAPRLLLMGHTDVVPVSPEGWQRDPFGGGRGAGGGWGGGGGGGGGGGAAAPPPHPPRSRASRTPPPRPRRLPAARHPHLSS